MEASQSLPAFQREVKLDMNDSKWLGTTNVRRSFGKKNEEAPGRCVLKNNISNN